MLKRIRSRKKYYLLPFLALFYLVLGAHALHPYFHDHSKIELDQHSHHQTLCIAHPHLSINGQDNNEDSSCPICTYFVLNSVIKSNSPCFHISPLVEQCLYSDYQIAVTLAHQTGFLIRGPPSISPV